MNTNNIKVSVITAVLDLINNNRAESFKQMLQSVQEQTFSSIEHIIIDGNSNDGTQEFISKLISNCDDVRFISEEDTGIYNAFNKGVAFASGECLIFLNSDDFLWDKFAIESLVEVMSEKQADFACASAMVLFEEKKELFQPQMRSYLYKTPFCHQTMLCKKDVIFKYKGFNEKYKFSADYELIVKIIISHHSYVILDKIVVGYRVGGLSSQNAKLTKEEIIEAVHSVVFKKVLTKNETIKLFKRAFPIIPVFKVLLSSNLSIRLKLSFMVNIKYILKNILRFRFIVGTIENCIRRIRSVTK